MKSNYLSLNDLNQWIIFYVWRKQVFQRCKTEEEIKRLWKRLLLRLHPDHGGCDDLVVLLNESKDTALKDLSKKPTRTKSERVDRGEKESPVYASGAGSIEEIVNVMAFMVNNYNLLSRREKEIVESIREFFSKYHKISEKQLKLLKDIKERCLLRKENKNK